MDIIQKVYQSDDNRLAKVIMHKCRKESFRVN